ncbi:MAG TPA: hypothetical protein VIN61_03160 [Gammaproteobacteria bacterium]
MDGLSPAARVAETAERLASAAAAGDWDRVAELDAALAAALASLAGDPAARGGDAAAALRGALAAHGRALDALRRARDAARADLERSMAGRRGVGRYLEVAAR